MKRKEFTRKDRAFIIGRANGSCEQCNAVLKSSEGEVDHKIPCSLGGDNSRSNGWLLCRLCHAPKTKQDIRQTRKADRQRDRSTGAIKPKGAIKSAGFQKSDKRPKIDKTAIPTLKPRGIYG